MSGSVYENKKSPWDFQPVDAEINKQLLKHFRGERIGYVQIGPMKYFLPHKFGIEGKNYYNFKPRPTDVWVVSFPRSGTTWTQEMVWLLGNDLNYTASAKTSLIDRFPFLEFSTCVSDDIYKEFLKNANDEETKKGLEKACGSILDDFEKMTEPRYIKTHLPLSLLPPDLTTCGAKVIYVARNPKDVAASYYNFHQFIKTLDYVGDFETFWNFFEQNLEMWTPYWDHLNEAWNLRNTPNVLFLFYEDLKKDLKGGIKKVANFLQKQYNEQEIDKLADHLDFKNFQNNQSVNMEGLRDLGMLTEKNQRCIRQGKAGGWKELFTPELNDQANRWIKKNLENTDMRFPDSL